jgi:hypothetical protein
VTKPVTVPARRRGIDCGVCGLPGLGVREITARHVDGDVVRQVRVTALACCYCHSAVRVFPRVDTPPHGG